MKNLSKYDLGQIAKMLNLSQNKLEQIAKMRPLKKYNNMSKEELLVAFLKSNQSFAELQKSKSNNAKIKETTKIFNELKNSFSKKRNKRNQKNLS